MKRLIKDVKHAGTYAASMTATYGDGPLTATATTTLIISQAKLDTPNVPQIEFYIDGDVNKIRLTDPLGAKMQYRYEKEGTSNDSWQSENIFVGIKLGYYYYFYAKEIGDRDHIDSDISRSSAYLATGGNIVYISNDIGIRVELTATGTLNYVVSADTGYHLYNYHDNSLTAVEEARPIEGKLEAYCHTGGILLDKSVVGDEYHYSVTFVEGEVAFYQMTLDFRGVAKDATVDTKGTNGQTFIDFNNESVSISRDSSFTAQFTVKDIIPIEYTSRRLEFSQNLPKGSTIILKTSGVYWYYTFASASDAIDLNQFIKMGGSANYAYDLTSTTVESPSNIYQIIVDFSKADSYLPVGELNVTLGLVRNGSYNAPTISISNETHLTCALKQTAEFVMDSTNSGKDASLDLFYTESVGSDSIWDNRNASLVLMPSSGDIPSDMTITATVDGLTTTYSQVNGGMFIIPLSSLDNHDVALKVHSETFDATPQTLTFNAKWYVSSSMAAMSPLSGDVVATRSLSFSCTADAIPSIRIDGDVHVLKAGETLNVTIRYLDIPAGGAIIANVQSKNDGVYVDTGDRKVVTQEVEGRTDVSFNIGSMSPGSYRVLVIVTQDGGRIMQVPYYFIVIK